MSSIDYDHALTLEAGAELDEWIANNVLGILPNYNPPEVSRSIDMAIGHLTTFLARPREGRPLWLIEMWRPALNPNNWHVRFITSATEFAPLETSRTPALAICRAFLRVCQWEEGQK